MAIRINPKYLEAKYDLSLIGHDGKVIYDPWPMRTNMELSKEQMEDGVRNGFEKYAIPLFIDENENHGI